MYIMLSMVYSSLFLAVAACTFNWPMIDLLRNKNESLEWTTLSFKCDQQKRKANMEIQCGSTQRKIQYIIYEKNMEITL